MKINFGFLPSPKQFFVSKCEVNEFGEIIENFDIYYYAKLFLLRETDDDMYRLKQIINCSREYLVKIKNYSTFDRCCNSKKYRLEFDSQIKYLLEHKDRINKKINNNNNNNTGTWDSKLIPDTPFSYANRKHRSSKTYVI
ncbi:MAG: hypothetical protein JKX76_01075 [Colwellia sp.]|nr:hypothetical protein [Colwellia sp.]